VFEPFVQLDGALNRQFNGTGLGLALSKMIIDHHKGGMTVESKYGEGSKFVFWIPINSFQNHQIEQSDQFLTGADKSKISGIDKLRSLTIMVVDDIEINLIPTVDYLTSKGHTVVTTNSGPESLELFNTQIFDVIIMDIQMPGMSGIEVISIIRSKELISGRHTPIIALTALAMNADREMCLGAGADIFLPKPIKLTDLNKCIYKIVSESNS
jgi:CheY-like chemotaxis protein